jgi:hypothetical protein
MQTYRFVITYSSDGTTGDQFVHAMTLKHAWLVAVMQELETWTDEDLHEGILKMEFDSVR